MEISHTFLSNRSHLLTGTVILSVTVSESTHRSLFSTGLDDDGVGIQVGSPANLGGTVMDTGWKKLGYLILVWGWVPHMLRSEPCLSFTSYNDCTLGDLYSRDCRVLFSARSSCDRPSPLGSLAGSSIRFRLVSCPWHLSGLWVPMRRLLYAIVVDEILFGAGVIGSPGGAPWCFGTCYEY